jgi:hypothetical protein
MTWRAKSLSMTWRAKYVSMTWRAKYVSMTWRAISARSYPGTEISVTTSPDFTNRRGPRCFKDSCSFKVFRSSLDLCCFKVKDRSCFFKPLEGESGWPLVGEPGCRAPRKYFVPADTKASKCICSP